MHNLDKTKINPHLQSHWLQLLIGYESGSCCTTRCFRGHVCCPSHPLFNYLMCNILVFWGQQQLRQTPCWDWPADTFRKTPFREKVQIAWTKLRELIVHCTRCPGSTAHHRGSCYVLHEHLCLIWITSMTPVQMVTGCEHLVSPVPIHLPVNSSFETLGPRFVWVSSHDCRHFGNTTKGREMAWPEAFSQLKAA